MFNIFIGSCLVMTFSLKSLQKDNYLLIIADQARQSNGIWKTKNHFRLNK